MKDQIDHGHQKNYPLSQSEMPNYGEPLRIVTKLPPSTKIMEKNCCSKPQYLRNRVVVIPEVGLKSAILARTLIVSPFFEQVTPSRSSGKEGGISTPPPGQLNKILKFDSLVVLTLTLFHISILTIGGLFSGHPIAHHHWEMPLNAFSADGNLVKTNFLKCTYNPLSS